MKLVAQYNKEDSCVLKMQEDLNSIKKAYAIYQWVDKYMLFSKRNNEITISLVSYKNAARTKLAKIKLTSTTVSLEDAVNLYNLYSALVAAVNYK